jgi:hypothetical protein
MIHTTRQQDIWELPAGTVVRVRHGFYEHVAMLGEHAIGGERAVVSFSAQADGFVEEPFSIFARGQTVVIEGYLGVLPPVVVMQRARMKRGQAHSLSDFNCEHFVRHAHGVPVQSPQLRQWAFLGGVVGILALSARA